MSAWDDVIDGAEVRRHHKEKITMKKIMSLMLGMSLVIGSALWFAVMMYSWLWSPLEEEH